MPYIFSKVKDKKHHSLIIKDLIKSLEKTILLLESKVRKTEKEETILRKAARLLEITKNLSEYVSEKKRKKSMRVFTLKKSRNCSKTSNPDAMAKTIGSMEMTIRDEDVDAQEEV